MMNSPEISVKNLISGSQYDFPIPCFHDAYWRQLLKSYSEWIIVRGFEHYHDADDAEPIQVFESENNSSTGQTLSDYGSRNFPKKNDNSKLNTPIHIIAPHFNKPIKVAAKDLNIGTTFLKIACRRHGIFRWPHRKLKSLQKTLHSLESKLDTCLLEGDDDDDEYISIVNEVEQTKNEIADTLNLRT